MANDNTFALGDCLDEGALASTSHAHDGDGDAIVWHCLVFFEEPSENRR